MEDDKKERARIKLLEQLKNKYINKINKQKNIAKKEEKWIAGQTNSLLVKRNDDANKVCVEIDSRTKIMVDRAKCIQLSNGKWKKKENEK